RFWSILKFLKIYFLTINLEVFNSEQTSSNKNFALFCINPQITRFEHARHLVLFRANLVRKLRYHLQGLFTRNAKIHKKRFSLIGLTLQKSCTYSEVFKALAFHNSRIIEIRKAFKVEVKVLISL